MIDLPPHVVQNLLSRIEQHDEQAFKEMYRFYAHPLYVHVRHLHNKAADAEEIVHDVLFAVFDKPRAYSQQSSFCHWLRAIAKNKVIDLWRKQGRRPKLESDQDHDVCDWADPTDGPVDALINKQEELALERCRDALPIEQKEAFYLAFYRCLNVSEIAHEQNCAEGTVKSRLHKARSRVKDCIQRWQNRDNK